MSGIDAGALVAQGPLGIRLALTRYADVITFFDVGLPYAVAAVFALAGGVASVIVLGIAVIAGFVFIRIDCRTHLGIQEVLDTVAANGQRAICAAGIASDRAIAELVAGIQARSVVRSAVARLSGIFRTVAAYFLLAGRRTAVTGRGVAVIALLRRLLHAVAAAFRRRGF